MYRFVTALSVLFLASPALAGTFDSGSDGSDGALSVLGGKVRVVDLGLAATASWDTASPVPGQGVYDPELWAVVFKYTTIDIGPGAVVRFTNHPSGAPVVWLAQGQVAIEANAEVNLDGDSGAVDVGIPSFAEPGPGGFAGGQGGHSNTSEPSPGFGPGGGLGSASSQGGNAGHNGPGGSSGICGPGLCGCGGIPGGGDAYAHEEIHQLLGGSGGSGGATPLSPPAGAGGGAITIASSGSITLDGTISARGGDGAAGGCVGGGGGSGGTIRLMAGSDIAGSGAMSVARGNHGGMDCCDAAFGRVRMEGLSFLDNIDNICQDTSGIVSCSNVMGPVFPELEPTAPTLRATMVAAEAVPLDPNARILTPDVVINTLEAVTIAIDATNIPPGVNRVAVRIVPERGDVVTLEVDLVGTFESSTATATVVIPPGRSEIQLRANWP